MEIALRLTFALLCLLGVPALNLCSDLQSELRHAQQLEAAGNYPESMAAYRAVLQSDPNNLEATIGLGRAHYLAHQFPEAAQRFERALELSPANSRVLDWLARSYLGSREAQKSIDLLRHEHLTVGETAWAHLLLGHAYESQEKLDEARSELNRALTLDPHCKGAHFALGFIAWTRRDLPTAENELRRELALPAHEYQAFYYLSETLELKGKLDEAEIVLKTMGDEMPGTYLHHFAVAKWNELKGNFAAAAEQFQAAIQIDSEQLEAHYHLAINLHKLGRSAAATAEFNRVKQLRAETNPGMAQGMGKMRPHLPLPEPPSPTDP